MKVSEEFDNIVFNGAISGQRVLAATQLINTQGKLTWTQLPQYICCNFWCFYKCFKKIFELQTNNIVCQHDWTAAKLVSSATEVSWCGYTEMSQNRSHISWYLRLIEDYCKCCKGKIHRQSVQTAASAFTSYRVQHWTIIASHNWIQFAVCVYVRAHVLNNRVLTKWIT